MHKPDLDGGRFRKSSESEVRLFDRDQSPYYSVLHAPHLQVREVRAAGGEAVLRGLARRVEKAEARISAWDGDGMGKDPCTWTLFPDSLAPSIVLPMLYMSLSHVLAATASLGMGDALTV